MKMLMGSRKRIARDQPRASGPRNRLPRLSSATARGAPQIHPTKMLMSSAPIARERLPHMKSITERKRSEERRVGKECRTQRSQRAEKKKRRGNRALMAEENTKRATVAC